MRCHREFLVCTDFIEELGECFGAGCCGSGFGLKQVGTDPGLVDAGLSQSFGYDSGLLEFDSKAEVD